VVFGRVNGSGSVGKGNRRAVVVVRLMEDIHGVCSDRTVCCAANNRSTACDIQIFSRTQRMGWREPLPVRRQGIWRQVREMPIARCARLRSARDRKRRVGASSAPVQKAQGGICTGILWAGISVLRWARVAGVLRGEIFRW